MPLQIGFGPNCEVCGGVNQVWSYFHNIFCPPWSPFYSDKCNFSGHWHKQLIFETFLEYMSCKITNNRYMKMLMKFQIGFGPNCAVSIKNGHTFTIFSVPLEALFTVTSVILQAIDTNSQFWVTIAWATRAKISLTRFATLAFSKNLILRRAAEK